MKKVGEFFSSFAGNRATFKTYRSRELQGFLPFFLGSARDNPPPSPQRS